MGSSHGSLENRINQINREIISTGISASLDNGRLSLHSSEDIYLSTPYQYYDSGQIAKALGASDALFNDPIQEVRYTSSSDTQSLNYGRLTILEKGSNRQTIEIDSEGKSVGNTAWSFQEDLLQGASLNLSDLERTFTNDESDAFGIYANVIEKHQGVNRANSFLDKEGFAIGQVVLDFAQETIYKNLDEVESNHTYVESMMRYQIEMNQTIRDYVSKMYEANYEQDSFFFTRQIILKESGDLLIAQSNIDQEKAQSLLFRVKKT